MLDHTLQDSIATAEESKSVPVGRGIVEIQVVKESIVAPGRAKKKRKVSKEPMDWKPFVATWRRRSEEYERIITGRLFLTPTLLKRQEEELTERSSQKMQDLSRHVPSLLVGEIAHRFLQEWDFAADPRNFSDQLKPFLAKGFASGLEPEQALVQRDLEEIFGCFFASAAYRELGESRILGREVPLLIPWDGQIMEGVIDLLYEYEGLLYCADYKTDRIQSGELPQVTERYRHQAQIYSEAARRSLQREVAAFKLIFLRLGEAVEVQTG